MTPIEFTQQMKILATSYGKDFDEDTITVWYQYFKNIEKETFKKSLNKIITTNKFMPSIAEILEKCKKEKNDIKLFVLEKMKENGYFKSENEYDKALTFLEKEIIPNWLLEDMKKYYNNFLINKEVKMIGE